MGSVGLAPRARARGAQSSRASLRAPYRHLPWSRAAHPVYRHGCPRRDPLTVNSTSTATSIVEDISRVATLGSIFHRDGVCPGRSGPNRRRRRLQLPSARGTRRQDQLRLLPICSGRAGAGGDPSLIIGNEETGPPEVVQQLHVHAASPSCCCPTTTTFSSAGPDHDPWAPSSSARTRPSDSSTSSTKTWQPPKSSSQTQPVRQRVLFILQPPEQPMLVAGEVTAAGSMISLAGGTNVYPTSPATSP